MKPTQQPQQQQSQDQNQSNQTQVAAPGASSKSNAASSSQNGGVTGQSQSLSLTIGHYTLGKSLGKGTFGKVKLAVHTLTGEKVAVKILEKDKIKDKKDVERITREIKILKKVRHPNVIQLYEIIETESELFLIMEFCQGGELFDYIVAHQRLSERVACKFYQELIAGIEYIHQSGICHRDLKPENLLLDFDKTLKIVDFGLSNMYEGGSDETLKTACGSPCYAAPEMIAGKRYKGLKSDIWSSGVVLFAMVCGYLPFEDPKTSNLYKKILAADYQLPKFVSSDFTDFLRNILNTNPDQRFDIDEIRNHPWFKQNRERRMCGLFPGKEKMPYNQQLYNVMQDQHKFDHEYAIRCIEANRHNQITATYHLLHKKYMKMNKSVSDYPTMGQAGSIDRGASSQYSKAQRVQRQEQLDDYIKKRGSSINPQSNAHKQDLNQTLPTHLYPNGGNLQSVNGGEEKQNLNGQDNDDLTAQKRYKLQLQAEINKLQQKYQGNGKKASTSNSKKVEDPVILPTSQVVPINDTPKNMSSIQVNKQPSSNKQDQFSPTSDNFQAMQKQPSSQSRRTNSSSNQNNMLHNGTKMPSAAATESTNNSSFQNHNALNDFTQHRMQTLQVNQQIQPLQQILQQTIQQQHQRFKTQNMGSALMDKTATMSNGSTGTKQYYNKNPNVPSQKYSIANSAEKPKNQFNVTAMKFNSGDMSQGHKTSSSVNKTVIVGSGNYSTLDPIDINGTFQNKKNTAQMFNQTMSQFTQIVPERGTKSTAQKRGTSSLGAADSVSNKQDSKFNTIISSLNMSQIVSKNNQLQPMSTTQDYSYPISLNTTSKNSKQQPAQSKLNELRLQTPIDLVNFRTYTNSNQNKNAGTGGANTLNNTAAIDFILKNGPPNGKTQSQGSAQGYQVRSHQRYNGGSNGSAISSSTATRQSNAGTYSPVQNKDPLNNSANLNIQELYKQYQKKQQMQQQNNLQYYSTKPPTSTGGSHHYRAISVIDSSKMNTITGSAGSGVTNRQTPQIMINPRDIQLVNAFMK